jgi:hypothetical protein
VANVLASAMVSQHREIRELQVGGILVWTQWKGYRVLLGSRLWRCQLLLGSNARPKWLRRSGTCGEGHSAAMRSVVLGDHLVWNQSCRVYELMRSEHQGMNLKTI